MPNTDVLPPKPFVSPALMADIMSLSIDFQVSELLTKAGRSGDCSTHQDGAFIRAISRSSGLPMSPGVTKTYGLGSINGDSNDEGIGLPRHTNQTKMANNSRLGTGHKHLNFMIIFLSIAGRFQRF